MPRNRFHRSPQRLAAAALAGWVALGASLACACTIPVFRYALERWESDRFLVIVYHDAQLTAEQGAAIKELELRSVVAGGPLNIDVIRYDLTSASPPKLIDVKPPANQPLPWVEVRSRVAEARTAVRWQGPLAEAVDKPGLFESPARREIVRRLLDGDSSVWLLVAPEDQAQQLSKQLQGMLDTAPDGLTLPQGIGLPGSELYAPIPLLIRFSVLPISHSDPEEQALKLLAASAGELRTDAAYVIPVFGRCRALEVFPFADANEPLIEDVGSFLCAACSCRVKQANPGFDLLVSASWEQRLFGDALRPETKPSAATDISSRPDAAEYLAVPTGNKPADGSAAVIPTATVTPEDVTTSSQPAGTIKTLLLLVALALVSGGILGAVIFIRRSQPIRGGDL